MCWVLSLPDVTTGVGRPSERASCNHRAHRRNQVTIHVAEPRPRLDLDAEVARKGNTIDRTFRHCEEGPSFER
jgi:hypothetical protein